MSDVHPKVKDYFRGENALATELILSTAVAQYALKWGFCKVTVIRVLQRHGSDNLSAEKVVELCLEEEETPKPDQPEITNKNSVKGDGIFYRSTCGLDEEEQHTLQTCRVCLVSPRNCVFEPCRHLVCCKECSSAIKLCPICRKQLIRIIAI